MPDDIRDRAVSELARLGQIAKTGRTESERIRAVIDADRLRSSLVDMETKRVKLETSR